MQIREIMKQTKEIITCTPNDTVTEAAKRMNSRNIGCVLITEGTSLKGIITDRDITMSVVAKGKNPAEVKLKDIMKSPVTTGHPEWDLFETTKLMAQKKIRRLPIQSDGVLEGFISMADLAPVLRKEMDSFLDLESFVVAQ